MPTKEPARPRKTTTPRKTTKTTTPRTKTRRPAPVSLDPPGDDRIRERAYQFFLERGGRPGDPLADWLRAESELIAERSIQS